MSKSKSNTKKPTNLNTRQEKFCEFIVAGESQTDAYLKAGYKVSKDDARAHAARLITNDNIKAHIAKLRAPQTKEALRTKDDNLRWLADCISKSVSEIGPDSPLCVEYIEERVSGGTRGKLRRGHASSGNEVEEPIVMRRRVKKSDPLRAIEIFSKLLGHYAPDKLEVDATPAVLQSIRERAQYVAGILSIAKPEHLAAHVPEPVQQQQPEQEEQED